MMLKREIIGPLPNYPFLSHDTYLVLSDHYFDGFSSFRSAYEVLKKNQAKKILCFTSNFAESDISSLLKFLKSESNGAQIKNITPIFMFGDRGLLRSEEELVSSIFSSAFTTNMKSDCSGLYAIPLGLENATFGRGGDIRHYIGPASKISSKSPDEKRNFFSAFSLETNKVERKKLRALLSFYDISWDGNFKLEEYMMMMSESLFTLSPPGNGPDCHRTWEAIYLNSVPVVLNGTLPMSMIKNLPILEVGSWDEILQLSKCELISLYEEVRKKRSEMAYADYWRAKIRGEVLLGKTASENEDINPPLDLLQGQKEVHL